MNKLDLTLYLVTDSTGMNEEEFLGKIESACKGGVTLVQLREKERSAREYLSLARKTKEITSRYGVPLIIDDRADIASASGADGVHVGQSDLPVIEVRKLLGKDKIVGATAKTPEQAEIAIKEGADYLGVGAIFPTTTKVVTVITEVSTLKEITAMSSVPVIAIGGLNRENIDVLKGSGISGIAVVSAIMKSSDCKKAAEELRKKIEKII